MTRGYNSFVKQFEAAVVGSGPNGLCAAIVLAAAGLRVGVYEASETLGGGARMDSNRIDAAIFSNSRHFKRLRTGSIPSGSYLDGNRYTDCLANGAQYFPRQRRGLHQR